MTDNPTRTPLYGHNSPETAYLVDDYPYGRRLRCKIRYWLEFNPKKGFRLVSQTTNPKAPGEPWNKPKSSTYALIAGCMYLDENRHVKWAALSEYDGAGRFLAFVRDFPGADLRMVRLIAAGRIKMCEQFLSGERYWTINGVRQPETEADRARHTAEIERYTEVVRLCDAAKGGA